MLNTEFPYDIAIPFVGSYPKEMKTYIYAKKLYMNIYSCLVHNTKKVETTQMGGLLINGYTK